MVTVNVINILFLPKNAGLKRKALLKCKFQLQHNKLQEIWFSQLEHSCTI